MSASAFVNIGGEHKLVNATSVMLHRVESADVSVNTVTGGTTKPFTTVRVVNSHGRSGEATLFVIGSPAERAETLRRFAATLTDAAVELEASEGVAV
jgi:hypothetical protein